MNKRRKYSVIDPKYPLSQTQYNIFRYTKKYDLLDKIFFHLTNLLRNDQVPNLFKLKNFVKLLTHGIRDQYIKRQKINQIPNSYLQFQNKNYYEIDYGRNTRPSIIVTLGEKIQADINSADYDKLILGVALLRENNKVDNRNLLELQLSLNETNFIFKIPTDENDHLPHWEEVISNPVGSNWLNLTLDIEKSEKPKNLKISGKLLKKNKSDKLHIAFGTPKLIKKKKIGKKKNIICLIGESFIDPDFFTFKYGLELKTPNLDQLRNESHNYKMAYSQSNWTLPYISSMLTGLYPSQHNYTTRDPVEQRLGLNNEIKRISEVLSDNDYYTIGNFTQVSWYPDCGWAKGFDEYKFVPRKWSKDAVNINWVIDALNNYNYQDLAIFSHFDRLHKPYVCLDQDSSTSNINVQILSDLDNGNKIPMIKHQIETIDKEVGVLIGYLKNTKQFDNTMIIISGDHGISPPNWKKGMSYSDFEEMIRVPLIIKQPKGTYKNIVKPVNANTSILHEILKTINIQPPDYIKEFLDGNYISYKGYAVTETIRRPDENKYSISLTDENFRYWLQLEMNWDSFSIQSHVGEKLFKINKINYFADESIDLIDQYPEDVKTRQKVALEFLNSNLKFQKKYPISSLA